MALKGIVPVTLTPMNKDGSPDIDGIYSLVEYLCKYKFGGLYVLGTTGEHMNLTFKERLTTAKAFIEANKNGLPLLIGASSPVVKEVYHFLDKIADFPLYGVHVILFNLHIDDKRVIDTYIKIADYSPHPIWLYHNPRDYRGLTMEIVKTLREHPNIKGMKVGQFNLSEHQDFCSLIRKDFEVIGAGGGQILPFLVNGAQAVTCSTACVWPEEHIEIYELYKKKEIEKAREKQYMLREIFKKFNLMMAGNGETSAEEKALLEIKGVCKRWVSPPFRSLTDEEIDHYRRILNEVEKK